MAAGSPIKRGGNPEVEVAHGKTLLAAGAPETWGWATPAGQYRARARARFLQQAAGLGPGVRAMECGCGTGIFTRMLAQTGCDLTSVDISPDMLAQNRAETEAAGAGTVTFVEANLESPGDALAPESFDAIVGVSVLHHLDLEKALPELAKLVKPGGRLAFSEPNLANPINKYWMYSPDLETRARLGQSATEMAFTYGELKQLFEGAGLVVDGLWHRDFLHPSIPRGLIWLGRLASWICERTPLLRRISGSLWISAHRPA